jgi:hypothetical protein
MMKATALYRIAAVLFIVFAAGHTAGFLRFRPPTTEAAAVRDAMKTVHFQVGGSSFTYGGFYTGFGLFATLYLVFAAYLAWHLGALAATNPQAIGALAWVFVAVQVVSVGLSWIYFAPLPAIISALVAACLGWAAWLVT